MPNIMTSITDSLEVELNRQISRPPGGDLRIAAFASATLVLLGMPDGRVVRQVLDLRTISGSYAANLLLRCLQRQLLELDERYPEAYQSPESWAAGWERVLKTQHSRQQFFADLSLRQVQSNVSERYKSLKLIGQLTGRRGPRILDLGASQNHGLKRLALNLSFTPVTGKSSAELNSLLNQPWPIGPSCGADLAAADNDSAAWARACSFYPSELLDTAARTLYDKLDAASPANVDFVELNAAGSIKQLADRNFDLVFASTFLYQLRPGQVPQVRKLAKSVLATDGIIVYQDFIKLQPDGRLSFPSNWHSQPFVYRTIVEKPATGEVLEAFQWQDGRCRGFKPGRDYGRLSWL